VAERYIKNMLINNSPGGMKALNQNFDYLYFKTTAISYEIAGIQILSDDSFRILFVNGIKELWSVKRENGLISSLVSAKRVVPISHTL